MWGVKGGGDISPNGGANRSGEEGPAARVGSGVAPVPKGCAGLSKALQGW